MTRNCLQIRSLLLRDRCPKKTPSSWLISLNRSDDVTLWRGNGNTPYTGLNEVGYSEGIVRFLNFLLQLLKINKIIMKHASLYWKLNSLSRRENHHNIHFLYTLFLSLLT